MLVESLKIMFNRDQLRLKAKINLYQKEESIWVIDKNISNSAGNLCLHLVENLNTYIGKEIGGTNYVRKRELEFSRKDVSRAELVKYD